MNKLLISYAYLRMRKSVASDLVKGRGKKKKSPIWYLSKCTFLVQKIRHCTKYFRDTAE